MTVLHAPEFNIVNALQFPCAGGSPQSPCPPGTPSYVSMLYNVLPNTQQDAVLYSAYESTNPSPNTLPQDIPTIHSKVGSIPLLMGEFGYSRAQFSEPDIESRADSVISTAYDLGIQGAFWWVLSDNNEFGLYDTAFNTTPIYSYFQGKFQ